MSENGGGPGGIMGPGPIYTGPEPDKDSKTTAMLAHLLGIFGFVGPLIVWLVKKEQGPFVDDQGKEALNFHLTLLIAIVAAIGLSMLVCLFKLLPLGLYLIGVVFSAIGANNVNQGVAYRYPINLRLIK